MGLRTVIVAAALLAPAVLAQSVWQQCGGVQYTGGKNCEAGTHCVFVNDYYSQCQPGAPAGVTTTSIKTTSTTSATKATSTTSTKSTTATGTVTSKSTSTTAGPVVTGTPISGNPFIGYSAYANPYYSSEIYTSAIPTLSAAGKSALAAKASQVAQIGTFVWLDTRAKVPTLEPYLTDIRAKNAAGANPKLYAPFVVYDLPDRDCAAKASNGELSSANGGSALYKAYIDSIYDVLVKFTDVNTILIIEPDSLANMVTNMSVQKCTVAAPFYKELTAYALKKLNLPHVTMYLDGGHAGWLGWPANLAPAAKVFGDVYKSAGSPRAVRGLVTNVSNYNAYQATTCAPITSVLYGINGVCDEKGYVNSLAPLLVAEGFPAHFIVDISRNGKQPTGQTEWGHWCNIKGTGFGVKPTHSTNDVLVDSLVWVKPGGESDGTSDSSAVRYDSFCGSASSFTPAPEAGTWFQAYFEQLLTNAAF
ncbi:cellobiohydrolase II [Peziza echinospora]|nr:cellobiohydrolase II [Peziza echinospora]